MNGTSYQHNGVESDRYRYQIVTSSFSFSSDDKRLGVIALIMLALLAIPSYFFNNHHIANGTTFVDVL